MHYCSSCGHKVSDNDKFCGNCGAAISAPPVSENIDDPQPSPSVEPPVKPPAPEVAPQVARVEPDVPKLAPPRKKTPVPKDRKGKGGLGFFGVVVAFGWLFYSSGLLGVFAGAYRFDIDRVIGQADWISFGLMIGLPLGISMFRPILDVIITPLQFIKFRIPPRVLIGAGLLAPFAVSWVLYSVWGFRNYQFLHYSLVFGTLITYAILRTPRRYSV